MSRSIMNDYAKLRNPEGTAFYPNQWENAVPEHPKTYTISKTKKPAVIFDMDGTLCDVTSVRHHVLDRRRKNYKAFHYGSLFCPPIQWVVDKAHEYKKAGFAILVVTARHGNWRELTSNWLDSNGIPFDELHMRTQDDMRKDKIIKGEILDLLLEKYDIKHAFDDNPSIIELWQERGVPYTHVPGWAEEYTTPVPAEKISFKLGQGIVIEPVPV